MKKNLLILFLALSSLLTTAQVTITINVTTTGTFSTALTSAGKSGGLEFEKPTMKLRSV
jgi:hypothetical protein